MSKWVSHEYGTGSKATNRNALADPYVKAISWASHRLGNSGIVAFVTNSGFLDSIAADGMRKRLAQDFNSIFLLDLGGNVRRNPKLSGTTHNVFGIQVGVSINILIRKSTLGQRQCSIRYARLDEHWRKEQKYNYLDQTAHIDGVLWKQITPDEKGNWLLEGLRADYAAMMPLGPKGIFEQTSNGLKTNRDAWTYNFDPVALASNVTSTISFYNSELDRWKRRENKKQTLDQFVNYDDHMIAWSRDLKADLERGRYIVFSQLKLRNSTYRPFVAMWAYFDRVLNEEVYSLESVLPDNAGGQENKLICLTSPGGTKSFSSMLVQNIPDVHLAGDTQCFPFYTYDEDGTNRRENITDWALEQFRVRYADPSITKWDIFHYIYAVLHHPEYRERYAANLRRELPRIPFVSSIPSLSSRAQQGGSQANHPAESRDLLSGGAETGSSNDRSVAKSTSRSFDCVNGLASEFVHSAQDDKAGKMNAKKDAELFRALAAAGKRLAEIHVHYEQQPEYPLTKKEKAGEKLDWRVTKIRLSKDKTTLAYNQFLTLSGIPPGTYEYRLGNRSALEWVIDQYQVSTDKRSGITNDPNRSDDPQYIVRLIGQVITVSLETVKIVRSLPPLGLPN